MKKLSITAFILFQILIYQSSIAREWVNPDIPKEQSAPVSEKKTTKPTATQIPKKQLPSPLSGALSLSQKWVCNYQSAYTDKGSGGKIDGSFYFPNLENGYSMIGGYVQGNYHEPNGCIKVLKPTTKESSGLLAKPDSWSRVWKDKGSGANLDGAIWRANTELESFVCLGDVASKGYSRPSIPEYVCVHRCLLTSTPLAQPVWSTRGTGAKQKAYIYKLQNSNSFITFSDNQEGAKVNDLKSTLSCQL